MKEATLQSIRMAKAEYRPFKHWTLSGILSDRIRQKLDALPFEPPDKYAPDGARDTSKNGTFVNREAMAKFPCLEEVAAVFSDANVVESLEHMLDRHLRPSFLRIGFYVDSDGFWLTPHTDLAVKLLTLVVFVSKEIPNDPIGTDLYSANGEWQLTVPSENNAGLLFMPATDTFHGLERRRIVGKRKTMIVNYVTDGWINRHELTCHLSQPAD
jgi:hypothetical protein